MLSCNDKITLRQLQILLVISAMGTGLIVLPRRVAVYAAQDGWLIVLGLTLIGMGLAALAVRAARVTPNASFIEYTGYALTRPVAYVLGVFLWVKLVFAAGFELRFFLLITKQVLLNNTPLWVVSLVMLVVCAYAAFMGIEARARVAEVLAFLLIMPFVFLLVVALLDINVSNLQPVFTAQPQDLLRGTLRLGFIFTGLECLLLTSPYIPAEKKMGRAVVGAVGFAGVTITVITAITLAKFGTSITNEAWPVLRMMDMLNLPASFIERQEALMFSFWIITVFALVNAFIFFGARLVTDMQAKQKNGVMRPKLTAVLITSIAVFAVSLIPSEAESLYRRLDILFFISGIFFLLILPLLVLASTFLRRRFARWRGVTVLLVIFLITLSGCYDRVEIEDRTFVVAMALEKNADAYAFTVVTEAEAQTTADGQTLTQATHTLDKGVNKRLHYGQVKLLALGECLLSDAQMLSNALATLAQNPEIDRKLHIIAANECIDLHEKLDNIDAVNFAQQFQSLHTQLQENGCALIPLFPTGAVALKDGAKALTLSEMELQGYLWCFSEKNIDAVVTAYDVTPVPFIVDKHSAEVTFSQTQAIITVEVAGRAPEATDIPRETIQHLVSAQIANEIVATASALQVKNLDAYHWRDHMRKTHREMYEKNGSRWETLFPHLEIIPNVTVRLTQ
ncbi:MAG: endospore germination permease [Defluviitaleaceae bacterium]|nr:endospore germination permease [Defluviitaleaceae bacterium]MCL2189765.1 endospore germination permease [Defluviitaleaceae bacterium]MCL2275397.1 endospore germination permease [Defluviitaleaceae bacterium]